jgi:hypothetical protein
MDERGDPARSHMPSGFLVIDIQDDGGRAGYPSVKYALQSRRAPVATNITTGVFCSRTRDADDGKR